jgi:hypothetical protein
MRLAAALLVLLAARGVAAAEAETYLTLDARLEPAPGFVPEAAPRRLVLLEDGTVYVGGSRHVATGRLEKADLKDLDKRLDKLRKQGLTGNVSFGPGSAQYHLVVAKGKPFDVTTTGDPDAAAFNLRPLAALVKELAGLDHPSLHPSAPAFYAVSASQGTLAGGCREWNLPISVEAALGAPQPVSGAAAADWPTGAVASSVCVNDKAYVVTLRPLLPGERP